jgi:hypothetical protein
LGEAITRTALRAGRGCAALNRTEAIGLEEQLAVDVQ